MITGYHTHVNTAPRSTRRNAQRARRRATRDKDEWRRRWQARLAQIEPQPLWGYWFAGLPPHPLCCNTFADGVFHRELPEALTREHVQLNSDSFINCLVFDVDEEDSFEAWERANLPAPNAYIQNPDNGHGHLWYALGSPVGKCNGHRSAPIYLAADVERGMTRRLGADPAYANQLTKNPLHPRWRTSWFAPYPYTLTTLLGLLDRKDVRHTERREETFGISRNCDMFNELRRFAYRNVLAYKESGDLDAWRLRLLNEAHALNVFALPLATSDLRSVACSVAKWTWRRFSPERFSEIQAARGREGAAQRWQGHVALSVTRPWEAEGISRATWFRHQQRK